MPEWYFFIDQEYGPLSWPQLLQAAAAGQLQAETPVRRSDLGWTTAGQIPELMSVIAPHRPAPATVAQPKPVQQNPVPRAKTPVSAANPKAWAGAPGTSGIHVKNPPRAKSPIPAGVPVGAPARAPVGIPVGTPAGIPLRVAPAPPRSHSDDDIPGPRKKQPAGMGLIIGLGIASVVLGSIFVVVLVISTSKKKKPDSTAAAKLEEPPVDAPIVNPTAASNPIAETPVNPTPVNPVSTTPAVTPPPATKKLPVAFKEVRRWTDAASVRKLKSTSLRLELVNVYLAADETGTPVSAAKAAATEEPAEDDASPPVKSATAGRFIFAVIQISNISPKSLTYRSWNQAGGESTALLADDRDTLLTGIAPAQTPGVSRLTTVSEIPSQKMIKDTLVFAAPDGDFSKLRLVLPHAAVSGLGAGYFGFEIPHEILTAAVAATPQTAAVKPPAGEPAAEPEPVDEPAPTVAAPTKPKANEDGMMSKEDFLKSINGPDDKKKDDKKPTKASDGKVGEKMEPEQEKSEK